MRRHYRIMAVVAAGILAGNSGIAVTADTDDRLLAPQPRVSLLELYTSEGCSSCPPADRWVSALPRPFVPDQLVVLAFHVDYWNYLGWPDRFSQKPFSERQQALVRANGLRTAYTPQLVLNGRDYRGYGSIESQVMRLSAQPAGARLELQIKKNSSSLNINTTAGLSRPAAETAALYVVLFENNLETQVKAGENKGRRLRHDYVVRELLGPFPVTAGKGLRQASEIRLAGDWKPADLGVAAFVQRTDNGEILQATARMLR